MLKPAMIGAIFIFLQNSEPSSQSGLTVGNWIAIAAIVVPVVIGIIWWAIVLVFRSGQLIKGLDHIGDAIKDIKEMIKPLPVIEDRVTELWRQKTTMSQSPVILNEYGNKILESSKIRDLTTKYYDEIVKSVKNRTPENSYQAQEIIIQEISKYKDFDKCSEMLEQAAFISGAAVDTVLLVAAYDVRDKILKDLGLSVGDIDKFAPEKK